MTQTMAILLPHSPECWNYRCEHCSPLACLSSENKLSLVMSSVRDQLVASWLSECASGVHCSLVCVLGTNGGHVEWKKSWGFRAKPGFQPCHATEHGTLGMCLISLSLPLHL